MHEPAGRIVSGRAWPERRLRILSLTGPARITLDLGCGSGSLLMEISRDHSIAVGVDPSKAMRGLAKSRGCKVIRGTAATVPAPAHQFDRIVVTYPGPWIAEPATWVELERVTKPGATIGILLGGTYTRGPFSCIRQILAKIAYGNQDLATAFDSSQFGSERIPGEIRPVEDEWGTAWYWIGKRR